MADVMLPGMGEGFRIEVLRHRSANCRAVCLVRDRLGSAPQIMQVGPMRRKDDNLRKDVESARRNYPHAKYGA